LNNQDVMYVHIIALTPVDENVSLPPVAMDGRLSSSTSDSSIPSHGG